MSGEHYDSLVRSNSMMFEKKKDLENFCSQNTETFSSQTRVKRKLTQPTLFMFAKQSATQAAVSDINIPVTLPPVTSLQKIQNTEKSVTDSRSPLNTTLANCDEIKLADLSRQTIGNLVLWIFLLVVLYTKLLNY